MLKRTAMVGYFLAMAAASGCGGENAVVVEPTTDGSTSTDGTTGGDALSTDANAAEGGDGSPADAALEDSSDGLAEAAPGPGGDGGLVLGGGDAGSADASFQLKNPAGTNFLSSSDVTTSCATVAGTATGTFVMTCKESNGTNGPCRTVTVVFGGAPVTGRTYTTVAKAAPADGEAVVSYQESIDCTAATTNGWVETESGGDFKIDVRGDTAIVFTLHDVPMSPAPSSSGVTNQNAMGSFTLAGSGQSTFPYD
jgi:hypothetical protein